MIRSFVMAAALGMVPSVLGAETAFTPFAGDWQLVDVRNSQIVATPISPLDAYGDYIGRGVAVTDAGPSLEGLSCEAWALQPASDATDSVFTSDPTLSDLRLPDLDGQPNAPMLFDLLCEGEGVTSLYIAGPRVAVAVLQNDSLYAVFERVLTPDQVIRLQEALWDQKYRDASPNGVLDEATLDQVRNYYRYRQTDTDAPVPRRPAITATLLEGLNVLDP